MAHPDRAEWDRLWAEGWTLRAIAERYGCRASTVAGVIGTRRSRGPGMAKYLARRHEKPEARVWRRLPITSHKPGGL